MPSMETRDRNENEMDSYHGSDGVFEPDDNEDMTDYDKDFEDNWNDGNVDVDAALMTGMVGLMDATPSTTCIAQTDQPPEPS